MRIRNEKTETGHLLSFISKSDPSDNFSFFFPVEGLDQFDTLLEITKGFEKCLEEWPGIYNYNGYSINKNIEKIFPEMDETRIYFFEQTECLSAELRFIESFGKALLKRFIQKQNVIFPDIVTGAMAAESNFYNRETTIQNMWELLCNNRNIQLRAPRRFGKTSLLNHITKHPQTGWQVCFVDLEGGDSAEKFVEKILAALLVKQECVSFLPDHLSGLYIYEMSQIEQLAILRKERETIQRDWKIYVETIFSKIENQSTDNHFLIILDEMSFLIEDMLSQKKNSIEDVTTFMNWFHDFRSRFNTIRFILTGSEHLPSFLNAYEIKSRLDDLESVQLNLFDEETTEDFIFLVLAGQKVVVSNEEIHVIKDLVGKPIPYFLQLLLDAICEVCKEQKSLSNADIVRIYEHRLLGSNSKRYFESITRQLDRYDRYKPRNTAGAKSILDKLALSDDPVAIEDLKTIWQQTAARIEQFDIILEIMKDDIYLAKDENDHIFIDSKLIKEWWQKHGIAGLR